MENVERESDDGGRWENSRLKELKDGDGVVTPDGDISMIEVPLWYDEKLFNKAKKVYKEHFAGVNFSHLCGLLLSFYFTKNIKTLKSTGESDTKYTLFHRYLATVHHIQKWYEGDVWDPKDPAHKSLTQVRSMHAKVAEKMATLNDGVVYVSQWDMAVTQWAFVGPLVLFRSKVGLHCCSEEEYESLIHFWRVIGYLLGVEDQYNLCTGDYDQVVQACKVLLKKEYRTLVETSHPSSVEMGKSVVTAMKMIDPILNWEMMSNYIHELIGIQCPDILSFSNWLSFLLVKFTMVYAIQFPMPRALLNDLYRWRLDMASDKDIKFAEAKKYIMIPRSKEKPEAKKEIPLS